MKQESLRFTRAALLMSAAVLFAMPAAAQDAAAPAQTAPAPTPTVVAPPVVAPAPAQTAPAPTAPAQTAPAQNEAASGTSQVRGADPDSTTPINPAAAAQVEEEAAERRAAARPARAATRPAARATRTQPARAPALVAAPAPAPAPTPTPLPSAAASAPAAPSPAATEAAPTFPTDNAAAPADETVTENSAAEAGQNEGGSSLIYVIGAIVLIALVIGVIALLRRRRAREEFDDVPVYMEPAPEPVVNDHAEPAPIRRPEVAPPVAAVAAAPAAAAATEIAPATADEATVVEPAAADVDALTAAAPAVAADRPWLEFAMRPVRAGTTADEVVVEIELTVGNAGTVDAQDVRISTLMVPANLAGDIDALLAEQGANAEAVDPLTIPAGEGTRVDARLALPRAQIAEEAFQPVVVTDARYALQDGGEGRTSASFTIGYGADGELALIDMTERVMREDVEARLFRDPVRI